MKAVQINNYGGPEVFELNESVRQPSPHKNQILVAVHVSSINPFDWKVRVGYMKDMMPLTFPAVLGGDISGVVAEVGEGVTEFKLGDEVFGSASFANGGSGAFAEFAAVNVANIALKPKSLNFEEAAALPLVGSSSIQALEEHIKLQSGQKILIHGGAGGIGHIAIQLAKALGAYVATTVSTDDIEFVRELRADEVVDYKKEYFEEKLKDYDAVFDTVGGETTNKSFSVLKKGGVLVSMAGMPDQKLSETRGVTAIGQGTKTNASHLKRLGQLVDNGKIKVNIDKVFPLDEIKQAFEYQEKIHPRGKVVLSISS